MSASTSMSGGDEQCLSDALRDSLAWLWVNRGDWHLLLHTAWQSIRPGGRLHPQFFFEAKGHLGVELLLVAIIFYLVTRKSFKPSKKQPLSVKEQEELIAEWEPEPLVPREDRARAKAPVAARRMQLAGEPSGVVVNGRLRNLTYGEPPVIQGHASAPRVRVVPAPQPPKSGAKAPSVFSSRSRGKPRRGDGTLEAVNFASTNFLGLADASEVEQSCHRAVDHYGCGSCGPRGFYGTIDVHLDLEAKAAQFIGTEGCVLYAYDVATPSSAIPAFCKQGDLVLADCGVSYAIQSGIALSKSRCLFFRHNDPKDLERVLVELESAGPQAGSQTQRKFIVVEAVYQNYGDVAPLSEIVRLKDKYGYRLIMDESLSLGVLGTKGRGVCEHFGVPVDKIDILVASLGHALGSVGGICGGSQRVCDHQRLSGAGYVFSASLPPYLAAAALKSIEILDAKPELVAALAKKARRLRELLTGLLQDVPSLAMPGGAEGTLLSPLVHLQHVDERATYEERVALLQEVVEACLRGGVLVTVSKYSYLDECPAPPSIKLAVGVNHEDEDIVKSARVLTDAAKKILLGGGK